MYIDKLDDIVDECNNTYHRKIKVKPVNFKFGNYIEYNINSNDKIPKFQVGDNVRTSKYKNTLKFFWLKKLMFHGHMLLVILILKKLLENSMKKNFKIQIKKNLV